MWAAVAAAADEPGVGLVGTSGDVAVGNAPRIAGERPLPIRGATPQIVEAAARGPLFCAPQLFQGFEDYYNPRLKRLRDEYRLDEVVAGERDEFRRILRLRHWVHTRWSFDFDQDFKGDAFAILENLHADNSRGIHA